MLLRQITVLTTNDKTLAYACKEIGAVEQSYYCWRDKVIVILLAGGIKSTQQSDIKKAIELAKGF